MMPKKLHTRGTGQVRGWAEYLGGTRMRFYCPAGHSWEEDLDDKKKPPSKRVGAFGAKFYGSWWSKEKGGVTVICKACRRKAIKELSK